MGGNNKGFALITALGVSIISLILLASIFFVVLTNLSFSTKGKDYIQAIEVAKGVSQLVIDKLLNDELTCISCSPCEEGCYIDLSDIADKFPNYDIKAKIEAKLELDTSDIYGFSVVAEKKNSVEKSHIEFIYKKIK